MDVNLGSPVLSAVRAGNIDKLREAILSGFKVDDAPVGGYTPLMMAARDNHVDILKYLLICGANVHIRDEIHNTALYYATDSLECVTALLGAGSFINVMNLEQDTPLFRAARYSNIDVINALISAGASVGHINANSMTAYDVAVVYSRPADILSVLIPPIIKKNTSRRRQRRQAFISDDLSMAEKEGQNKFHPRWADRYWCDVD